MLKFLIWLFHIILSFIVILVLDLLVFFISNKSFTSGYLIKCAVFVVFGISAVKTCKHYDRRKSARKEFLTNSETNQVRKKYSSSSFIVDDFMYKMEDQIIRRNEIYKNINPSQLSFGYHKMNPIGTSSVENSEKYLSLLRTEDDKEVFWLKGSEYVESFDNIDDVVMVAYHLYLEGRYYKTIYICPCTNDSTETPKGFYLAEKDDRNFFGNISAEATQKNISINDYLSILQSSKEVDSDCSETVLRNPISEMKDTIETQNTINDSTIRTSENLIEDKGVFCRKCGASLYDDSEFCHKCGEKLKE